jgi:hypothetical protein
MAAPSPTHVMAAMYLRHETHTEEFMFFAEAEEAGETLPCPPQRHKPEQD